ncbi:hypothetical protein [Nocardioides sp. B-3]|uniref:hypothetical protein n=1 Tax=Nocardioides sp. B-3 TaxID=2895565 RepID=UPI0021523516|nr:hypothetical protein [Nocardioides sp. B-3]UUZ59585.1 hypothetical protein LP418_28130 [Nocardioides sp. B-3]
MTSTSASTQADAIAGHSPENAPGLSGPGNAPGPVHPTGQRLRLVDNHPRTGKSAPHRSGQL